MKTSKPVRIYLADLYANGLEPKIGDKVYRTKSIVRTESFSGIFGSYNSSSVTTTEELYGKFYGNPTTINKKKYKYTAEPWVKKYECANQYYNNLFLTSKNGHGVWAHNCYILRNVELL